MSENLFLGLTMMALCVGIQCIIVSILLRGLFRLESKRIIEPSLIRASFLLAVLMLAMLLGNLLQITLWAELFYVCGEFEKFATAFYHSAVNFTTLGYGDLVMSEKRRLLGALEAANGILMFALTTGFLYTILNDLMNQAWDGRAAQDNERGNRKEV